MTNSETMLTAAAATWPYFGGITFTGSTTRSCTATLGTTARGLFYQTSFIEPASGAETFGFRRRLAQ